MHTLVLVLGLFSLVAIVAISRRYSAKLRAVRDELSKCAAYIAELEEAVNFLSEYTNQLSDINAELATQIEDLRTESALQLVDIQARDLVIGNLKARCDRLYGQVCRLRSVIATLGEPGSENYPTEQSLWQD